MTGNPVDGFTLHGPYDSRWSAIQAGEALLHDYATADWWVVQLHVPPVTPFTHTMSSPRVSSS